VATEFKGGASDPRIILSDGRSFALGDRPLIVGRSPEVDIVLNDNNISRRHCEFWRTSEGVAVRDLGSTNGTFVNGHKIDAVSLSPRDDVSVAQWHLRIELA
jgi:pSer/pThr/pTyr-binding forkhead associated (FHA) protein